MPRLFFVCLNVSNNPNSLYDASWQLEQADLLKRMKTDPTQPKKDFFLQKFVGKLRKIQVISEAIRRALLTRINMCIHLVITIY